LSWKGALPGSASTASPIGEAFFHIGGWRMKGQLDLVQKVIEKIGKKLQEDKDIKGTIGDLVRLIQLEKEIEEEIETPDEIKVTWVDQRKESLSSAK
jgi:hypothetical protein